MDAPATPSQHPLELAMRSATETPTGENLQRFYATFLSSQLLIPIVSPGHPLPKNREKPLSPFSDLLSLEKNEQVFVLAFTTREELLTWSRQELDSRTLSGADLCKRLPERVWISINPEGEFGKELSPWEVERLRSATEYDMSELIAEVESTPHERIKFQPLEENTFPHLTNAAREVLSRFSEVTAIFAGLEMREVIGTDSHKPEEFEPSKYLIGIEHDGGLEARDLPCIHDTFARTLVGDIPFKISFAVKRVGAPEFSIFYQCLPLISQIAPKKRSKFWNSLRKLLTRL